MSDHTPIAETVTLSYPADLSEWGRDAVDRRSFRRYLGKAHDTASVGDVWDEFVGVGCCDDTLDVPLRVEAVDGQRSLRGDDSERSEQPARGIDDDTAFAFEERAECGIQGGWEIQSETGP